MQSGVPQGSVLSRTLYNLYINDTPQAPGVNLALFADDTCNKKENGKNWSRVPDGCLTPGRTGWLTVGRNVTLFDLGSTRPAGKCTFSYGKWNENHELCTCFNVYKRIIAAVRRVRFVSDRMLYVILKCRWCHVIVLESSFHNRA
jgi:hypothetical protein